MPAAASTSLFNLEENEEGRMVKVEAPSLLYQDPKENKYAGLFRSVQEAAEHRVDEELGGLEEKSNDSASL